MEFIHLHFISPNRLAPDKELQASILLIAAARTGDNLWK